VLELSKKLRQLISGHFNPEKLETIDEFIQFAGNGVSTKVASRHQA
jgi:hypothetical protein